MRKSFTGWALAALLAGGFAFPLDAAPAKKKVKSSQAPKPAAAATARTTDINECGRWTPPHVMPASATRGR